VIDGVIGAIPFAGDLFDAGWKANQRNVRLLRAYLDNPRKTSRTSSGLVAVLGILMVGVLVGTSIVGFLALRWLLHAVGIY
jgi:hypothetical protein